MDISRRRAIELAGTSIAGGFVAGCVSGDESDAGDENERKTDSDGTEGETDSDGTAPQEGTDTETRKPTQEPTDTDGTDPTQEPTETDTFGSDPHVDEPPYEIVEPECGDGERDPLWLCANMPADPSIGFEQESTRGSVLVDEGLSYDGDTVTPQFYATFLTDESDLERIDQENGDTPAQLAAGTDFAAEAVLVVQTGWGSGTVTPHLKRIEETDDGIHAYGCYYRPCGGTSDFTSRTVLARFERPDTLSTGAVSLTVDVDTRVTFSVDEGVVTVGEDG
jgi:hypothetical protein